MKKLKWILIFLAVFLIIFSVSSVLTYEFVLDKDANRSETPTDNYYADLGAEDLAGELDETTYVTRVTPGLNDATVVRGLYTKQYIQLPDESASDKAADNMQDISITEDIVEADLNQTVSDTAGKADSANKKPSAENTGAAPAKKENAAEEKPKAESVKTDTAKTEVKKAEAENKEDAAAEAKNEPIKEEQKAQTPNEPAKSEEPVQVKPQLDPDKQYSDTGL